MKTLKIIGLALFLIGFLLFNAVNFTAHYRLTADIVKEKISDKKRSELFLVHAGPIMTKTFSSSGSFVSALKQVFDEANAAQLRRYSVTDEEIADIVQRSHNIFQTPVLDSVFRTSNEIAAFKNKSFRDLLATWKARGFNPERN
jgi:hypothetical protein